MVGRIQRFKRTRRRFITPAPIAKLRGMDMQGRNWSNIKVELPSNPPKCLNEIALQEWERMGQFLFKIGVITKLDGTVLALYCDSYACWIEARVEMQKEGMRILQNRIRDRSCYHAWIKIYNDEEKSVIKLLRLLGLTPLDCPHLSAIRYKGKAPCKTLEYLWDEPAHTL